MSVEDLDIDSIDDLGPIEHELEDACVALESLGSGLTAIYGDIVGDLRGINRNVAQQIHQLDDTILPSRYPVNSFTLQTSQTNLKPALEAIEGKTAAVIAAIATAIAAFIYKIYQWITKSSSSMASSASAIEAKSEKLDEALDKRKEVIQAAKQELTPAEVEELKKKVMHDERVKAVKEDWGRDYNELIHYAWNQTGPIDVAIALRVSYSLLTRMVSFVEAAANMYVDLVNNPSKGRDETPTDKEKMMDEWLGATSTRSVIHTVVYPGMTGIIRELEACKIKADANIQDDILRAEELTGRLHKQLVEMAGKPMEVPDFFYEFWTEDVHPVIMAFRKDLVGLATYHGNQNMGKFEDKVKRISDRVESAAKKHFPESTNPDLVKQLTDMRKVITVLFKIIANLINVTKAIMGPVNKYYDNNLQWVRVTSKVISVTYS